MKTKFTKGEWIIDYSYTLEHIKLVTSGTDRTPTVAIYNNRTSILDQDPTEEELTKQKTIIMGKLHECKIETPTSHFVNTLLPNVPTTTKHRGNRLNEKFFIGMFGNGCKHAL